MYQHKFKKRTFDRPSFCFHCSQYIYGAGKIGYKCRICHYVCHKHCLGEVPHSCLPSPPALTAAAPGSPAAVALLTDVGGLIERTLQTKLKIHSDDLKAAPKYESGALEQVYRLERELGSGGCATVYLARRINNNSSSNTGSDDSPVAVKRLDRSGFELSLLERELRIMRELVHPNIVRLLGAFQSGAFVDLVLELVQGGELFDAIVERGTVNEADARNVMRQLTEGILYVHSRGVAHRDLKAENVLLARRDSLDSVKIADFGLANVCGTGAQLKTSCGTPDYVAPEILLGDGYDFAVDMWSLGILAYVLLCGYPPFWADTQSELFRKIIECNYSFNRTDWAEVSETGLNFVAKLLVLLPSQRMSATAALHHPWLKYESAAVPLPTRAKTSARNLADYNTARKAGSATYVPLPVRAALASPLGHGSPATPARGVAARAAAAAGAGAGRTPQQFSTPQTPPPAAAATPLATPAVATTHAVPHSALASVAAGFRTPVGTPPVAAAGSPWFAQARSPTGKLGDSSDSSESSSTSSLPPDEETEAAVFRAVVLRERSNQSALSDPLTNSDDGSTRDSVSAIKMATSAEAAPAAAAVAATAAAATSSTTSSSAAASSSGGRNYSIGTTEALYELGDELGRGGCAVVYEARNRRTNGVVAVKRLSKAGFEMRLLERELAIMCGLDHPHILKLYDAFESAMHVDLVLEYVDGGELFDAIIANNGLAEADCARIVGQILSALVYMHASGVAHRDLKAENVLVSVDLKTIKIADFGLSNVLEPAQRLKTSCGTPDYVAPEVLLGEGYTEAVDVWSTGVLTYIMLCGYPPFYDTTQNGLFRHIIKGEFKYPSREWAHTSKLCRKFIRSLLVVDPEQRPRASACLQLPWLAQQHELPQVRRGNSVANLRFYQAKRAQEERPIPSQRSRAAAAATALDGAPLGALLRPEGEAVELHFTLGRELGRGGTAIVYEASENATGQRWAVKRIDRAMIEASSLQRELTIMSGAQHECILRLKAVYQTPTHIDVVTEHAVGGELFDLIVERGSFTENDARAVMQQVFRGVEYLHKCDIAHRDLKAENVLVTERPTPANGGRIVVKISDFGLSNVLNAAAQLKTSCGTPDYVAPEVLRGDGYEVSVDVWSAGVLAYIILCGYPPFYADSEVFLFRKIMDVDYTFDPKEWCKVSDAAKDFISHLLVGDPLLRYTATQALAHRWLAGAPSKKPAPTLISGGAASGTSSSTSPVDADAPAVATVAAGALPPGDELPTASKLSTYRRRRKKERAAQADNTAAELAKENASRSVRRRRKAERHAKRSAAAAAAVTTTTAAAAAAAVDANSATSSSASAPAAPPAGAASTAAPAAVAAAAPAATGAALPSGGGSERRRRKGSSIKNK